jgi:two-component system OmpR family response regulator
MTPEAPPLQTILVVEDDAVSRHAVVRLLRQAGYAVAEASTAREALAYLGAHPAPALVLLGLVLPDLPGEELRRQQLRDPDLAGIPVVVLSAGGEAAARADDLGDVGYLQKPVKSGALLAAVGRFARPHKPGVLVVEDEPAVLQMLGVALRQYGFTVRPAGSGEEAVRLYQEHPGGIDVALLDVQMPRGMDGPQTLDALRRLDPCLPAVFMSGNTGRYSEEDLLGRGAARVFQKPFRSLDELAGALWRLARPRGPASPTS